MRLSYLLLFTLLLWSCQTHISPHTKKGQSRINVKSVHTPYYITFFTTNGEVPFYVSWDGKVNYLKIEVELIIRPTSPRINFPIYSNNIFGNNYTVYRQVYKVNGLNEFGASLNIFQKGDYRVRATIFNKYWSESSSSYFKVD